MVYVNTVAWVYTGGFMSQAGCGTACNLYSWILRMTGMVNTMVYVNTVAWVYTGGFMSEAGCGTLSNNVAVMINQVLVSSWYACNTTH